MKTRQLRKNRKKIKTIIATRFLKNSCCWRLLSGLGNTFFVCLFFVERRKEEDYDEEVEEDLQDEVQYFVLHC